MAVYFVAVDIDFKHKLIKIVRRLDSGHSTFPCCDMDRHLYKLLLQYHVHVKLSC